MTATTAVGTVGTTAAVTGAATAATAGAVATAVSAATAGDHRLALLTRFQRSGVGAA